jgi:hypothetical protein
MGIERITDQLRGRTLTPAESEKIIAMVRSRVRESVERVKSLNVTVSVSSDDLLDVLAWHEGTDLGWDEWKYQLANDRWLAAYQDASGERRDDLWSNMPASLQWAVHEVEHRGTVPLRDALDRMGIACRPLTDVYVVCDRLLDAETNEHCEYDGRQALTGSHWKCPGCGARNYYSTETRS